MTNARASAEQLRHLLQVQDTRVSPYLDVHRDSLRAVLDALSTHESLISELIATRDKWRDYAEAVRFSDPATAAAWWTVADVLNVVLRVTKEPNDVAA